MRSLLHISASPRGAASESLAMAHTFLETLADVRPDISVETFDLWDGSLPEFGPAAAAAKMAVFAGESPSGEGAAAWEQARHTFERFAAADFYLFSVPMWNHGVPYILKQLIDVVSQPGMVFNFHPEHGYTGLLNRKDCCGALHQRRVRRGPPSLVRDRLPGALPQQLAALGGHRRRHPDPVPARPGHNRRRHRPADRVPDRP
ncbi:MAG: NAD(P)H-dependent oxidoreductase [Marmoricola sp.]